MPLSLDSNKHGEIIFSNTPNTHLTDVLFSSILVDKRFFGGCDNLEKREKLSFYR